MTLVTFSLNQNFLLGVQDLYGEVSLFNLDGLNSKNLTFPIIICILLCDALKYFIDSSEEDDVSNLTTNVTNPKYDYKEYEEGRLSVLQKSIWQAFDIFSLGKSKLAKKEVFIFENNMKGTLEIIHGVIICLRNQLKANEQHHVIWASILKF